MGKKRIVTQEGQRVDKGLKERTLSRVPKKKIVEGVIYIHATFNNTIITIADLKGRVLMASSSGSLGFRGAKKGTPFAAAKVAEILAEKAKMIGFKDARVIVRGVGSGRESAIRGFLGQGIEIVSIEDRTPVPHNGPRPKKPRRV